MANFGVVGGIVIEPEKEEEKQEEVKKEEKPLTSEELIRNSFCDKIK